MEIYPHQGNGVLYISTIDMLSGTWDGINEHGLSIFGLVDLSRHNTPIPVSGSRAIGLTPPQTMNMILENCKTIEEAKVKLLTSKTFDLIKGIHHLVADANGSSFIFEVNKNDDQAYITEGGGKPQIMTNTPAWDCRQKKTFRKLLRTPMILFEDTYN